MCEVKCPIDGLVRWFFHNGRAEENQRAHGSGNKATSALHLSHWFNGKYKVTVKQYDVEHEVLQIIEDDLSDLLRPAFVKKAAITSDAVSNKLFQQTGEF
jgi:hypothetical protein